ncbi:MAG: ubiquinone/menaquinone biosynthesis methyltransferase [Deltaproteobacteria bacterium]|nr:ubiquinone/menaquinone biosynthesis methyltransferase [Deltaproteobacteria bacterium]
MQKRLAQGEEKARIVRMMFDRIAPKYDFMNRLISLGMDRRWRKKTLRSVSLKPSDIVLDLGCGTGDLSLLSESIGATVIGIDFSTVMLRYAQARSINSSFIRANAANLPLADSSVSVVVSGFTLRNFVDLKAVLSEIRRVLIPTGRIALLEVSKPKQEPFRTIHMLYLSNVVPRLGAILSDKDAYSYLPLSLAYLPSDDALFTLLQQYGFQRIRRCHFFFGSAQLITAIRE